MKLVWMVLGYVALAGVAMGAVEVFPTQDIKVGQSGEWVSVVDGSGPQHFPLSVVGLSKSFGGPGRDIIWVRATDKTNIGTGPVAGMSGSPVYIDGKWAGAYAYGFTWPKNEALVGVTPAADMLAMLDENVRENLPTISKAKPMSVAMGGFSPKTVAAYKERLAAKGINLLAGAALGEMVGDTAETKALQPGDPVVGLLMDGDFKAGAVGTVSWVSDDGMTLLAFGHPFLGRGELTMPMASAEIVTVVSAYDSSFKLANVGEQVGAIVFDRQPGVVGKLGVQAPMGLVSFVFNKGGEVVREFSGSVWDDVKVAPEMVGMAFLESLNTLDALNDRQSYTGVIRMSVADEDGAEFDFEWPFVFAHDNNADVIASNLTMLMSNILDNPFRKLSLKSVGVQATLRDGWARTQLAQVELLSQRAKAGEELPVALTLLDYRGQQHRKVVSLPIPQQAKGVLQLEVLDSDDVAAQNLKRSMGAHSWDAFAQSIAQLGRADTLVLRLTQDGGALERKGMRLDNLPESVFGTMELGAPERSILIERELRVDEFVEIVGERIVLPVPLEEK